MSGYGHNYLTNIYEGLQDDTAMLPVLEASIDFVKETFKDERETLDHNFSIFWIKKIYLLDRTKQINESNILALMESDFKHFISSNEMNYVDLAEIAYENKAIDLALQILLKLIKGENSAVHIHQELVKWHTRFDELIAEGMNTLRSFTISLSLSAITQKKSESRLTIIISMHSNWSMPILILTSVTILRQPISMTRDSMLRLFHIWPR